MKNKNDGPGMKEFFVLILFGILVVFFLTLSARLGAYAYQYLESGVWGFKLVDELISCTKKSILGGGFLGVGAWVLSRFFYEKESRE